MEISRLKRDGTAEPVSRDQSLRRERGHGNIIFPCSAHHKQDWQRYLVDPYSSYMCDHTYMHTTRFSLSMKMSRLTRDGTAEPVSRDQILRRERGQGNIDFPRSADHVQDWQPFPVDPYSCYMCDHTYNTVGTHYLHCGFRKLKWPSL